MIFVFCSLIRPLHQAPADTLSGMYSHMFLTPTPPAQGYCNDDKDAFGVKAALACPVACDSCALGMCFKPATNEIAACDGDGQVCH